LNLDESIAMKYLLLYGTFFCAVLFFLFPIDAKTQENSAPTITSMTLSESSGGAALSSINLIDGSTKHVYVHGSITDADSCEQINDVSGTSTWSVVFFRTDVANAQLCTPDNRDCYQLTENNTNLSHCDGPGDTSLDFEMDIPIAYYADATDVSSSPDHATTDWTVFVEVIDDNEASTSSTITTELNTLKALNADAMINYGVLDLDTASTEQTVTLTNTGNNDSLIPLISDTLGWTCTVGTMGPERVHYNASQALGWENGTAVTATPTQMIGVSLLKSSGTPAQAPVYFTLRLPEGGLGGDCSSTLVMGAG